MRGKRGGRPIPRKWRARAVADAYRGRVATRPLRLDPALQEAVDRAREAFAASGQLQPRAGLYRSPLDEHERAAIAGILTDGTYRRLADAVAAEDAEIADQ